MNLFGGMGKETQLGHGGDHPAPRAGSPRGSPAAAPTRRTGVTSEEST